MFRAALSFCFIVTGCMTTEQKVLLAAKKADADCRIVGKLTPGTPQYETCFNTVGMAHYQRIEAEDQQRAMVGAALVGAAAGAAVGAAAASRTRYCWRDYWGYVYCR